MHVDEIAASCTVACSWFSFCSHQGAFVLAMLKINTVHLHWGSLCTFKNNLLCRETKMSACMCYLYVCAQEVYKHTSHFSKCVHLHVKAS